MSLSIWNIAIVGIVAVVAVYLYNDFVAGKTIPGVNVKLGRA